MDAYLAGDPILACQWAELHTARELEPEQRLCLAVLKDGLMNLTRPTGKPTTREMRRQDALQWLKGAEDCYMTFEFACGSLGIDADGFRDRLLRLYTEFAKGKRKARVSGPEARAA